MLRKTVVIIALCVFAFMAMPVIAVPFGHGDGYDGGTAKWDRKGGYYTGQGGEFTIWGSGLQLSNAAYANTTSGLAWDSKGGSESFQSFCIERGEYIYEPMRIWVSEEAAGLVDSTYYGLGSHAWYGGEFALGGDDLDPMTAYLYTQFATGILSDYDYDNSGVGRSTNAGQLQNVFWFIEDEMISLNSTQAQDWYDEAFTAVGSGGVWEGMGIGNVRILQMYKHVYGCEFKVKQDQLYLTPIPPSVIIGMLGICVAGIKLRKFA